MPASKVTVDTPFANSWADQEARRRAGGPSAPSLPKTRGLPCEGGIVLATLTAEERRTFPFFNR